MTEWWSYGLSDFLMFSAPTYYRLFERHNAALWPWQWLALVLGSATAAWLTWLLGWRGTPHDRREREGQALRPVCAVLGVIWCAVAWGFLWRLYAPINWAATGFAVGFALQGLVLVGFASRARLGLASGRAAWMGIGLLLFALWVQPLVAPLTGRPWAQAEVFGLAPDPTVLATLGVLSMLGPEPASGGAGHFTLRRLAHWLPWPLPLLWCLISGATLWTLHAPGAALMPAAGALALWTAWRSSRPRPNSAA